MRSELEQICDNIQITLGDDASFLSIAYSQGMCGCIIHGDSEKIAKSIFSQIHNTGNESADQLFRIIQAVVVNVLRNPSPLKPKLEAAINSIK